MLVKELRAILKDLPGDYVVVLAKDGKGNDFSPLAGFDEDYRYEPDSTWSGEVVSKDDCDEDLPADEDPCEHTDCRYARATPALVLWPTN